jgi:hypothetical protein
VPAEQPRIDVRDMAIVHRTFHRVYDQAAHLVRDEPTPTAERAAFLGDHIAFGLMMLHHHHELEDELLYPVLIERVPERAATTEQVEREHQLVRDALDGVDAACTAWRREPSAERGAALASSLDHLNAVLATHAGDEEREVVPLAAATLSQQEWDQIGKQAVAKIPGKWRPIAFGMMVEPLSTADAAYMKSNLPPPVRLLFPLLIERPWRKYKARLERSG